MKHDSISPDEKAAALLRVASYLGRPQQFMAIADARAEMRRTLELAAKGSVVLTTHGEPAAAVVPFATLEAEIEATFTRSQERPKSRSGEGPLSSEEEMEGRWRSIARSATTAP
jgi:antitoxin (DNA-binding transcriptional repressor) of toxin-antitoxin stability system